MKFPMTLKTTDEIPEIFAEGIRTEIGNGFPNAFAEEVPME